MTFDGRYQEWNQKRIKFIIDHYDHKFFFQKKILDVGCGHSDIGGALYRLGGEITAVDARIEHLNIANKKFPGIKTIQADLDQNWPFKGYQFDLILDMGILCHLRNYEQHLSNICAAGNSIVLETAVCDADDPNKCVISTENKGIYDNSINGISCRPTAAAIERVLTTCGMSFTRMDNKKLNAVPFVYDWYSKNNGDTSINQRRLWFITKTGNPTQIIKHTPSPILQSSHQPAHANHTKPHVLGGYLTTQRHPQSPYEVAVPGAPIRNPQSAYEVKIDQSLQHTPIPNYSPPPRTPAPSVPFAKYNAAAGPDPVRDDSRRFAVITPETFAPPNIFSDIKGTILPISLGSRRWFKKVASFFPHVLAHRQAISLQGFPKSEANEPDLVMCSIQELRSGKRVWLEEWPNNSLNSDHMAVLKKCGTIMTPSLVNMQEVKKYWPEANIVRVGRPWPLLNTTSHTGNHYIYLEMDPQITKLLFDAWQEKWGELLVVGSSLKLPSFAKYISEHDDYSVLLPHLLGAKAVIHLSVNTYYMSGIEQLARAINLPIISNNSYQPEEHHNIVVQIPQDNTLSTAAIVSGVHRFTDLKHNKNLKIDISYNSQVYDAMKTMVGS